MADSPPTVVALIVALIPVYVIVALAWTGIKGLQGGPVWLPRRSGDGGMSVTGGRARLAGAGCLAMALFLLALIVRALWPHARGT